MKVKVIKTGIAPSFMIVNAPSVQAAELWARWEFGNRNIASAEPAKDNDIAWMHAQNCVEVDAQPVDFIVWTTVTDDPSTLPPVHPDGDAVLAAWVKGDKRIVARSYLTREGWTSSAGGVCSMFGWCVCAWADWPEAPPMED